MLDLSDKKQAHIDERLRQDHIIWLTSVRPDGRPHSVAVWFLWDGNEIIIFSIPENQKIRNIRHDPRVFLALDDTKDGEEVITVEGTAELVDNVTVASSQVYIEKYAEKLKEFNWTPESMAQQYSQAIRIKVSRVR